MNRRKLRRRVEQINVKVLLVMLFYLIISVGLYVKVFYFQYASKTNEIPFFNEQNNGMLFTSMTSITILLSVVYCLFYKVRKGAITILYVILSLLIFGDTLYARYYYSPLNIAIGHQISFIEDIGASIYSLYRLKDLIFFVDLPIVMGLYLYIRKLNQPFHWKCFIFPISLIALAIGGFYYNYGQVDTNVYAYQRKYVARDLGVLYYHFNDIKQFIHNEVRSKKLTEDEKQLLSNYGSIANEGEYTGIAEGKNLIVIQLEAYQSFVIQNRIEGQEITPNLNQLIEESFYFDNIYHQASYGNTSDAEFLMNNSIFPAKTGAVYYLYPRNTYYALPQVLANKGYHTFAFHAYEPSFWNRTNMYASMGFEHFYSLNDFEMTEKIGWALSDKEFFRQSLEYAINESGEEPFYAFMVSLSSHHPYDAFINDDFPVGAYEGTQLGYFIKSAHYVDSAIGALIEDLKTRGIYEDTILVIYGDHSAIYQDQQEDLMRFVNQAYNAYTWKELQKVPVIIHVPSNEGYTISSVGGQVDILPMVNDLMALNMPYLLGHNLLYEKNNIVANRDGTVITDDWMYLPQTDKVYLFDTNDIVAKDSYMWEIQKAYEVLKVTDILLEKDALKEILE